MNHETRIKIHHLRVLIRAVGRKSGEDAEFLKIYEDEQVTTWSDTDERLDHATACFKDLQFNK